MKKNFFMVAAIILALVAGVAVTLAAQGPHRGFAREIGMEGRGGWMLKHMTRELNLTDAQQAQVKSIMQAERAKIEPIMQQLRQNEQAENAIINGNFDETQARAFANKQAQLMSDMIVEKQRIKSQIYTVLTPEQRQKALQLMQEREQRRQEHMQKKSEQQQESQPKQQ